MGVALKRPTERGKAGAALHPTGTCDPTGFGNVDDNSSGGRVDSDEPLGQLKPSAAHVMSNTDSGSTAQLPAGADGAVMTSPKRIAGSHAAATDPRANCAVEVRRGVAEEGQKGNSSNSSSVKDLDRGVALRRRGSHGNTADVNSAGQHSGGAAGSPAQRAAAEVDTGVSHAPQQQPQPQPQQPPTNTQSASLMKLSLRAMRIVARVDTIVRRCEDLDPTPPTVEERGMYEVFAALRNSAVGPLFLSHPEVSLSNRSSVICIPDFYQDEVINGYRLRAAYNAGTIGRSYFATRDLTSSSSASLSTGHSGGGTADDAATESMFRVLKVVSFVLRRSLMDAVTAEQRVLVNVLHENVLRLCDVLNDEAGENMIVITNYQPKGNIGCYAGKLAGDGDKLRRILTEMAVGLRILHSHKVYHNNLKLDNVLENADGHFCIADAGFWRLFASQCPEDLVFNGELASLPPEVFDPSGPYATGDIDAVSQAGVDGAAAVDIWGFGILMYRLAYGAEPVEIAERSYEQVRERVLNFELTFPAQPQWSFAGDLEEAIQWCLQKKAAHRPSILRLLRHPFFKDGLMGSVMAPRCISMTGSFAFGGAYQSSSLGDRTLSNQNLRGASLSNVSMPTTRSQQRNGFQVDAFLGEGRFSETLLVHLRRNPSKQFAFKIIYKSILKQLRAPDREAWANGLRRQLVICRKVNHPNIMHFIDIVEDRKVDCFVVQEYVQAGSIRSVPAVENGDSFPTLQEFLVDVLSGLVHLHDNGVVHLCLSPSNIFFSEDTFHYRLADFGPLFVTVDALTASIAAGTPLYTLPEWLRKESPINGTHVDVFCVGLLAASVLPEVYNHVWNELRETYHDDSFSVEAVLAAVRDPLSRLPETLIAFIEDALLGKLLDARAALQHLYFKNMEAAQNQPKRIIDVTNDEIRGAVHSKPETRDETPMMDALAQDPFQESQMLTSVTDGGGLNTESGNDASVSAGINPDRFEVLTFTGDILSCGQCGAELTVALYQCPDCVDYVRCGKCSVGDHHKVDHQLVPYVVYTIEHSPEGGNKAVLVHPSDVPDVHALETLEMTANFPVGSLTTQLTALRAAERSIALRSGGGTSITKNVFTDMESVVHLPDDVNEQSISTTINGRSSMSLRGWGVVPTGGGGGVTSGMVPPGASIASSSVGINFNRADFITPQDAGSLCLPLAPKFSLMKGKETKKLALPKAEEIEDDDWQQELERCRTTNSNELLLYSYGLESVPVEVYNPPLLQVVVLDLSQNSLTSLPHELSFLIRLRKLVVSYNKLTDLPDSLGNLNELESFDASHNAIEELPQTFIYLSSLTSAALDYNNFAQIPESLLEIMATPLMVTAPQTSTESCSGGVTGNTQTGMQRLTSSVANLAASSATNGSGSVTKTTFLSPKLKVIYLAANDRITTFPEKRLLERFDDLTIAVDNEPSLYKYYYDNNLDTVLPNITINWNKIYPDEIIPYLFCGSLRSAQSQMVYRKLNISYLLTVGRQLVPVPPEGGTHKVIVVDDIPGADIRTSFREAVGFIEESQQKKSGCLVHCFAGLSRSATTVIAYLMMRKNMRLDEAYLVAKKGRPAILPNKGFFDQLVELDHELFPDATRPLDIESLGRPAG
ncbi:putative dual specificity protein phosphatase [Leptomonas pyrrhocoris]|uniref:protein-serine/threonine phosphatase n=1 Tax=Leptomonas pyrrhocoris TaxID=157538 RepID=A0A0M9G514_LEPPY|nr:putative dual specificity protein phosphatase [Leptomonas pyrrhocoris]KPA82266.1 putative dual specificity protein phosphatase [Leptomonas pyrrhocoris]|eukprot:XP_015660705.1 putative dual specificity protein phosphatase [Leptomonas pyrrhocoris]